jgi:hypothetical protein
MLLVGEAGSRDEPARVVGKAICCRYRIAGDTLTLLWDAKDCLFFPDRFGEGSVYIGVYKRKRP